MSELANAILERLRQQGQFTFSSDPSQKADENMAVDYLSEHGYITVKMRTIGYVHADVV